MLHVHSWIGLTLAIVVGLTVAESPPCKLEATETASAIDLSPLKRFYGEKFYTAKSSDPLKWEFAFNICGSLTNWTNVDEYAGAVVNQTYGRRNIDVAAVVFGYWDHVDDQIPLGSLERTSKGAKYHLFGNNGRTTVIKLDCVRTCELGGDDWEKSRVCNISLNEHGLNSEIIVGTTHVCSEETTETELLEILAGVLSAIGAAIVFYFIIGAIYQYRKGFRGIEMIPNNSLWLALPGLVADGCRFSKEKVIGMRLRSSSSSWGPDRYEELLAVSDMAGDKDFSASESQS